MASSRLALTARGTFPGTTRTTTRRPTTLISTSRGTASYSIEAWVNLDTVDAGFRRILDHDDLRKGWILIAETTGGFQFYRDAGGVEELAEFTPSPMTGATYHVVGTYDGTDLLLYVNGVLRGGSSTTASVAATSLGVRRGWGLGTAGYTDGRLDELAVYATALSPERILAHYNAGAGVQG